MTMLRAYALLLVVTIIWAGNYPFGKAALAEIGPLTLTAVRAALAAPLLWGAARLAHGGLGGLTRREWTACVVISLTGLVGNTTVWYWGLAHTSTVNAAILGAAAPVAVALAAAALLGDRLRRRSLVGIALTAAAVLLTVARGSLDVLRTLSINRGDVLILVSQVVWVTYTLYTRGNRVERPPVVLQAGAHLVSAALLVPLALLEAPWRTLPATSWVGWTAIAYAVGPITLGHLWYYQIVRAVGAGRAAAFTNLMPFLVIAASWLFLGEPIHWYHLVGATAVIAGVLLATAR
jgi:drug/metabolite transporter (DMT)-like permease